MSDMTRIAIIGAGNVGGALYRSLKGDVGDDALVVCDTHGALLARLGARHALGDADAAVRLADAVIVAVKPQQFAALARSITAPLEGKLVVSVMAGMTVAAVSQALGAAAVVRCMPNLGAQVGRGATAWIAAPACTPAQVGVARRIFRAAGIEIEVGDESLLDAFTALGGTGPAYFFYLAELLAENAVAMGFDAAQGRLLAREVLAASARLLESGDRSAADWRLAVTTPGGTTAAAMRAFGEHKFAEAFSAGIEAARRRSEELSRG
jgi:pyrroline-5-carboxylate reductase